MKCIGIDLGTTNTVAAVARNVFDIDPQAGAILPSVVAFPPSGATIVGSAARRRRPIDPKNTIASAKRLIGRGSLGIETTHFRRRYPEFELVEAGKDLAFKTRAGVFTPVDIAAKIVATVLDAMPEPHDELVGVIAVPSMFLTEHREATLEAAHTAGLANARVIDEPLATALACRKRDSQTRYAAVYDMGGGTFDVAVVDCSAPSLRMLAHGGDLYLGGDDVDRGLAEWAAHEILERHNWNLHDDRDVFTRLIGECERAKARLRQLERTRIDLTRVDPASPLSTEELWIDSGTMTELTSNLVGHSFVICDKVLKDAGLKAADIDDVFVAGGATLLPAVQRGIEGYFGKPVRYPFHPMHIVAIGASMATDA
jgi:molecular chaperone DnaK (HSP70)